MKEYLLKEIANVKNGYAFDSSKYSDKGIPIIRIADIKDNIDLSKCVCVDEEINKEFLIKKGSLLIALSGATTGKMGVFSDNKIAYLNQRICSIYTKNKDISQEFLIYFLKSIQKKIIVNSYGGAQPNISSRWIENIKIKAPNIEIQKKISKKLELLTNNINSRKSQLVFLNELIKSLFIKYSKNKKAVNLELEEVCEFIKDGTHQTPTYVNTNENGYKFLSSKDVSRGIINWDNTKYISEELHKELYKKIAPQKNDILLAKNGTTGIAALVDKEEIFDIYVSLAILRLKKEYNSKYILEGINSIEANQQFKRSLKGIGVPNLHLKEIKKVKIPVPPIELQNKFAERMEKIEKLSFEIEKSIKEAENLYNSLISKYFD